MAIAFVSLLVLVIVVIIGIPILARVFSEAANRDEDSPGGEDEQRGRSAGRDDEDRSPGGR